MTNQLILVSNPGSASRKYSLYRELKLLAHLHFEFDDNSIVCTISGISQNKVFDPQINSLNDAAAKVHSILVAENVLSEDEKPNAIGIRVVAPSTFFQSHRHINQLALDKLHELLPRSSIHITATLNEIKQLQKAFGNIPVYGASDSAFHANKPQQFRHYGISENIADDLDVWRFGYHGLSLDSVVSQLESAKMLNDKIVVCHLGSGTSVSALLTGRSLDNTMGFSPLEGLIMSTRSGSIDVSAANAIKSGLNLEDDQLLELLNNESGLLGISGKSSDIRELLETESHKPRAKLALQMYVTKIQQAIGQMSATMGGIDNLVFAGTVGERSSIIRNRVCNNLKFLGVELDENINESETSSEKLVPISTKNSSVQILVVPVDETLQIAKIVESVHH